MRRWFSWSGPRKERVLDVCMKKFAIELPSSKADRGVGRAEDPDPWGVNCHKLEKSITRRGQRSQTVHRVTREDWLLSTSVNQYPLPGERVPNCQQGSAWCMWAQHTDRGPLRCSSTKNIVDGTRGPYRWGADGRSTGCHAGHWNSSSILDAEKADIVMGGKQHIDQLHFR